MICYQCLNHRYIRTPLIHYPPCANISTSQWNSFSIMNALVTRLTQQMLEDGYSRQKISQKILDDFTDNQNNVFFEIPSVVMLEYVELLKVWSYKKLFHKQCSYKLVSSCQNTKSIKEGSDPSKTSQPQKVVHKTII